MKTMLILLSLVLAVGSVMAQSQANAQIANAYIPRTLSAGTLMSARAQSSSYDDTTQVFQTRAFSRIYVGLETAANDSIRLLVSYQPSKDGVTFDALVLLDSLVSTGTVGKVKYIQLPANAMGAHSVRVRVYSNTDVLSQSGSPSATVTTKIVMAHY